MPRQRHTSADVALFKYSSQAAQALPTLLLFPLLPA